MASADSVAPVTPGRVSPLQHKDRVDALANLPLLGKVVSDRASGADGLIAVVTNTGPAAALLA